MAHAALTSKGREREKDSQAGRQANSLTVGIAIYIPSILPFTGGCVSVSVFPLFVSLAQLLVDDQVNKQVCSQSVTSIIDGSPG